MHIYPRHIVNGITLYRLITAPLLVILAVAGEMDIFKWMLAISFFTDAIDGWLARKWKATSIFGARLDSIGDDLTVLAGIIGAILHKQDFLRSNIIIIVIVLVLFLVQAIAALVRYGKLTSFHTYLAKVAAILQGCFLILLFFLPDPVYFLFYAAMIITAVELAEEILIVILLREWQADVRGLYWVLKGMSHAKSP